MEFLFVLETLYIRYIDIKRNFITDKSPQANEIYGTAIPIPSANAAALDANGIPLPSSKADANAAVAEEPEYIIVMAI
jgi:hypothetical protein